MRDKLPQAMPFHRCAERECHCMQGDNASKVGQLSISLISCCFMYVLLSLRRLYIDSELSMTKHVSSTFSSCFFQLRRLKAVRRSLPLEAAKTVISSDIVRRNQEGPHHTPDKRQTTLASFYSACDVQALRSRL